MSLSTSLRKLGYVPVVEIDHADDAVPLAEALLQGGIGCIEVTLRTPAALLAIKSIVRSGLPLMTGVGTLTRADQVAASVDAGAQFGVSPGYTHAIGRACRDHQLPLLPGTVTPSEVLTALDDGWEVLKFFPASLYGGPAWLKAIHGPIPQAQFCPTGGIGEADVPAYLACPNVVVVGGSVVAPRALLAERNWNEITARCTRLMTAIRTIRPL